MVQRPDDARTEAVQLLHGLGPQAEGQVCIQTVVPENQRQTQLKLRSLNGRDMQERERGDQH